MAAMANCPKVTMKTLIRMTPSLKIIEIIIKITTIRTMARKKVMITNSSELATKRSHHRLRWTLAEFTMKPTTSKRMTKKTIIARHNTSNLLSTTTTSL